MESIGRATRWAGENQEAASGKWPGHVLLFCPSGPFGVGEGKGQVFCICGEGLGLRFTVYSLEV